MCLWTEAPILCGYEDPGTLEDNGNNEVRVKRIVQQACEAFSSAQRLVYPVRLVLDEN